MAIQKCDNCKHHFSRKDIQKSFFKGFRPLNCPSCHTIHQIKDESKLIIGMIITFPIIFFILILSSVLGLSPIQTFVIGLVILGSILFMLPYIAKYQEKTNDL